MAVKKKKSVKKAIPKKQVQQMQKAIDTTKPKKKFFYIGGIVVILAVLGTFLLIAMKNVDTERSLPMKEYGKAAIGISCTDKCGDYVCDEIVCMAEGCPCSENYRTCPNDCHEARFEDLAEFAKGSECLEKGELTENYAFNPETRTWWINMKMKPEFENPLCSPACVIYEDEDKVEINWRCTGAVPE